jgi:hypothetical protein
MAGPGEGGTWLTNFIKVSLGVAKAVTLSVEFFITEIQI